MILFKIHRNHLCYSKEKGFLQIYLSPNATPWHHNARHLWGGKRYRDYAKWTDSHCVCDKCKSSEIVDKLERSEQKVRILRKYIQDMVDSDIDTFTRSVEESMRKILKETE